MVFLILLFFIKFTFQNLTVKGNNEKRTCLYGKEYEEVFEEYKVFESNNKNHQIQFVESKSNIPSFLQTVYSFPLEVVGTNTFPEECYGMDKKGDIIYCADWIGLITIDVSNVTNPVVMNYYAQRGAEKVVVSNNDIAFVSGSINSLFLFNVSNPYNITLLGSYKHSDSALGAVINEEKQIAFVANRFDGLDILDYSNPTNISLITSLHTGGRMAGIAISTNKNVIYLGDIQSYSNYSNKIIDVSDHFNPVIVGEFNLTSSVYEMKVVNDFLFVAEYSKGLRIYDISTPSNPILLGFCQTTGIEYLGIEIIGNFAYIASGDQAFAVIDISDLANPFFVNKIELEECPSAVKVSENYAFVGDYDFGLSIVELQKKKRINGTCMELGIHEIELVGCEFNTTDKLDPNCKTFSFELEVQCNFTCNNSGIPKSDCSGCLCPVGGKYYGKYCEEEYIDEFNWILTGTIVGITAGSCILLILFILVIVVVLISIFLCLKIQNNKNDTDTIQEDSEFSKELEELDGKELETQTTKS